MDFFQIAGRVCLCSFFFVLLVVEAARSHVGQHGRKLSKRDIRPIACVEMVDYGRPAKGKHFDLSHHGAAVNEESHRVRRSDPSDGQSAAARTSASTRRRTPITFSVVNILPRSVFVDFSVHNKRGRQKLLLSGLEYKEVRSTTSQVALSDWFAVDDGTGEPEEEKERLGRGRDT